MILNFVVTFYNRLFFDLIFFNVRWNPAFFQFRKNTRSISHETNTYVVLPHDIKARKIKISLKNIITIM